MTEAEQKIGDYISECVNRGSFSVEDMEEGIIPLIKQAGYKSPEEVAQMNQPYADILHQQKETIRALEYQLAHAKDGCVMAKDQSLPLSLGYRIPATGEYLSKILERWRRVK